MTSSTSWIVAGVLAGALSLWLVKLQAKRLAGRWPAYEAQVWGIALLVAAAIYVGFALLNGADTRWTAIEIAGLAGYGLVALVGIKRWPLLLGPAWLAHSLWAQLLHAGGHPAFVPEWYVPLCLGFDIVVGITLMATLRYKPKRTLFGFVKEPER
jgi:hypothetical protein